MTPTDPTPRDVLDYEQRKHDIILILAGGAPAKSAAAWLSAVEKAERDGRPCPSWDELERIAPSVTRSAPLGYTPQLDCPHCQKEAKFT